MTRDPDWLTWPEAAELAACGLSTIEHYARTGRIDRRSGPGRRDGSLHRPSVEQFANWWADRAERHAERDAERARRSIQPPEPEGWIPATAAARQLGYAHSDHIVYLARQGRFEARKSSRRWWVREADISAYGRQRDEWCRVPGSVEALN